MKRALIICLAICLFAACQPQDRIEAQGELPVPRGYTDGVDAVDMYQTNWHDDYATVRQLMKMPEIDKLDQNSNMMTSYWAGGAFFQSFMDQDLRLRGVQFQKAPGFWFQIGNLRVDATTTLDDFRKVFPDSYRQRFKQNEISALPYETDVLPDGERDYLFLADNQGRMGYVEFIFVEGVIQVVDFSFQETYTAYKQQHPELFPEYAEASL